MAKSLKELAGDQHLYNVYATTKGIRNIGNNDLIACSIQVHYVPTIRT